MKLHSRFRNLCLGLCVVLILAQVCFLVLFWRSLPDPMPAHYNLAGQIGRWGSRLEMLVLPGISILMLILMEVVGRHPKWWNIPAEVTEKNRGPLEIMTGRFLAVMEVVITAVFAVLFFYGTTGKPLPVWFAPIAVLGAVILSISGIYMAIRTADRYR